MKRNTIILLSLCSLLAACDTAEPIDLEEELDEIEQIDVEDEALRAEIEAGQVEAAVFGRPDESAAQAERNELRSQTCNHDERTAPSDFAITPPRGIDEPTFRVEEDQDEVARALADEADDTDVVTDDLRTADDAYLEAQARYLAVKDDLDPDERAARKEAILGE